MDYVALDEPLAPSPPPIQLRLHVSLDDSADILSPANAEQLALRAARQRWERELEAGSLNGGDQCVDESDQDGDLRFERH